MQAIWFTDGEFVGPTTIIFEDNMGWRLDS